ncbi:MAG: S46 family peptidase [Mucinivorans sp.]
MIKNNKEKVLAQINIFTSRINELYKSYMKAMMEMEPQRVFAADANSTLRVAYGTVKGYEPRDGVYYRPLSTLEGVMQKDNPEIYDYDVPERLRELYRTKDYGRWTVNGTVPVAFLATNHTTGGNSGSPVLNSNGELVGINFDRVWEGTMSDMEFDPTVCRNISLDIRYMLFLVDKFAGAKYLLEEMDIK